MIWMRSLCTLDIGSIGSGSGKQFELSNCHERGRTLTEVFHAGKSQLFVYRLLAFGFCLPAVNDAVDLFI